ncbi:MAG: MbnH family di-heme enzyme [Granulosicoccus sp.]
MIWKKTAGLAVAALLSFAALELLASSPMAEASTANVNEQYQWQIPAWLPPPPVPADNPMSQVKVELGRHLFYDLRLSADSTVSCATCHEQARGFSDGLVRSRGIDDTEAPRNSMTLANVGYLPVLTWANPHMKSLEFQALVPLFGDNPREMGNNGQEQRLFQRLSKDTMYQALFPAAFPEHDGAINLATITRALAAFQRSLISVESAYDSYKYESDENAISASAKRGEELFFSETAECYHCHQGFNFTDNLQTSRGGFAEVAFHNTGLYNLDDTGRYPVNSHGLFESSFKAEDMGRFRTPSLRNIAVSAPYFHDGSAATLSDVIDHYAAAGRTLTGEFAGIGSDNPYKDSLIKGFTLTRQERNDLLSFLHTLTDNQFLHNPDHANPWPVGHAAHGAR